MTKGKLEFTVTAQEKEDIIKEAQNNGYSATSKFVKDVVINKVYNINNADIDNKYDIDDIINNNDNIEFNVDDTIIVILDGIEVTIKKLQNGFECSGFTVEKLTYNQSKNIGEILKTMLV